MTFEGMFLLLITSHLDTVVKAQANGRGSSLDRVVMVVAGVHHQLTLDGPHSKLLVLREQLVSGNHESIHIGNAATWCQNAVSILESENIKSRILLEISCNIPNNLSHLLEDLMLHEDEDRCNLIGEHVGVGRGGEPFSCQRGHIQAAGQLVEEARVT